MALPINIDQLIHAEVVESERIEFKQGWNKQDILHSICAFANDFHNWGGGYIVIGISEINGVAQLPPLGLELQQIDKIQHELLELCHSSIRPSYTPQVEPTIYQGKHILILWVSGGQHRPYKTKKFLTKECKEYLPYIRKLSSSVVALHEDEHELYSLASKIPFDDCVNQRAKLTDIKLPLIQAYLAEVNSDLLVESANQDFDKLCNQMQLLDGVSEARYPRNIALLMFNDKPQQFFPYAQIDVVQFMAPNRDGDKLQEKIFRGAIQHQLTDVLTYLQNIVLQEQVIKLPHQAEAVRFFNYPFAALEEAIVNAVYHRGYQIREPVEITIFSNRIEILSFPGADRSIKLADLQHGNVVSRRYRNRRIGEFLKELKLTEGRSTGLPKIKRAMANNGSPAPIFDSNEERDYFLTILPIHEQFSLNVQKAQDEAQDEVQDIYATSSLTDLESKIIVLLTKTELAKQDILQQLGYKTVVGNLKRAMVNLLELELIAYTLPDKPSSKNQRYVLTAKGQKYLKNLSALNKFR